MTENLSKIKKICDILFHITDMDIELYSTDLEPILILEHLVYPRSLSKYYLNYYEEMRTHLGDSDITVCFFHEIRDFAVVNLDMLIRISKEESYYATIGPAITKPYSSELILELMRSHSISLSAKEALSAYYRRLPFFSPRIKNMFWICYNLLTMIPEPNYMNSLNQISFGLEDNLSAVKLLEKDLCIQKSSIYMNYELEALWRAAIMHGDKKTAKNNLSRMAGNDFSYRTPAEPLRTYKNMLISLNALCRGAATDAGVDALRIHKLHEHYAYLIESAANTLDIENIENSISVSYCDLVISSKVTGFSSKVTKTIEYICANFDKPVSLSTAACAIKCSKEHLSRLFHEETGKTFTDYLNGMRIEYAASLLTSSSLSVTDTALMVGFSSYTKFSIEFKQRTGVCASEYRKRGMQRGSYRGKVPASDREELACLHRGVDFVLLESP